jgi:hypothetical protein
MGASLKPTSAMPPLPGQSKSEEPGSGEGRM